MRNSFTALPRPATPYNPAYNEDHINGDSPQENREMLNRCLQGALVVLAFGLAFRRWPWPKAKALNCPEQDRPIRSTTD